jgi:hypothetical protein
VTKHKDMLHHLHHLHKRVALAERQIDPSFNQPVYQATLIDDATFGITVQTFNQATQPTGLNQSTDVGSEWINSGTGVTSWWDGFAWHVGISPYDSRKDLGALGPAAIINGRSFFLVTSATTAPGSPSIGDVWKNTTTSVYSQRQTSSWVAITDTNLINSLNTSITTSLVRVNFTSAAPGVHNTGDIWFSTDTWKEFIWEAAAWISVVAGISVVPAGDGSPPGYSPTPTGLAGIEAAFLSWGAVPNGDLVNYDVYSNSTNSAVVDTAHFVATTQSTVLTVTTLPGGTTLGTTPRYYYIVARDNDGSAPVGGTVLVTPLLVGTGDIAAFAITASLIAAHTITAGQIAATTITASEIAAGTITATQIAAGTITASQIAAGTITAANIAAGTLTADKMLIGFGGNAIANGGWETGSTAPHTAQNGGSLAVTTSNMRSGGKCGIVVAGATRGASFGYDAAFGGPVLSTTTSMPVSAGDVVYGEVWVRDNTASTAQVAAFIDAIDASGNRVSNTVGNAFTVSVSYQKTAVTYTVPAGVSFVALAVGSQNITAGNTYLVDDAFLSKQISGALIVNGAIDGKTITGAVFQTATSGQRVVIDSVGSAETVQFFTSSAGDTRGYIYANAGPPPSLQIIAPSNATYVNAASLQMKSAISGANPELFTGGTFYANGYLKTQTGYNDFVTNAANVWINTDFSLHRTTSLSKAKLNQKAMLFKDAAGLLEVTPKTWVDKRAAKLNGNSIKGLPRIPGFTAEDVEVHAPVFVTYDDDGLSGISYDRIPAGLLLLIQDLNKRVKVLENA